MKIYCSVLVFFIIATSAFGLTLKEVLEWEKVDPRFIDAIMLGEIQGRNNMGITLLEAIRRMPQEIKNDKRFEAVFFVPYLSSGNCQELFPDRYEVLDSFKGFMKYRTDLIDEEFSLVVEKFYFGRLKLPRNQEAIKKCREKYKKFLNSQS